jgi:class 3 adenylate cyclase
VIDDAGPSRPAAYRGFLFSDIRGFTAFAERHGNAAAAAAVRRFLDIARTAISRHEGAEIKTEGDAIHAVFPTASSAVLCGLDIVDAAAELNAREPERPLWLGVGVHAGEAVETDEGYIGRAVNIAARLCAQARPGEVLVSSTVKGITQASIPVGFIPRGRRRLKGIRDPIVVYGVSRDPKARARRNVARPLLAAAGLSAVVVLVALAAFGGWLPIGSPTTSTSAPARTTPPVVIGPLAIGTYASRQFQPRFTFEVPDPGWAAQTDKLGLFGLIREATPRGTLYFARVQEVITNPCIQGGEPSAGPAMDVIDELRALGHLIVSEPQATQLGGSAGRQVDVTVTDAALAACGGLVGADVGVFVAGGEVWGATSGERFKLVSVMVGNEPVTVVLSLDWTQTSSVSELEGMFQLGGRILNTVDFRG